MENTQKQGLIKTETPEPGFDWEKSPYSGNGGNCVEVSPRYW
jgi:hypothetical protein